MLQRSPCSLSYQVTDAWTSSCPAGHAWCLSCCWYSLQHSFGNTARTSHQCALVYLPCCGPGASILATPCQSPLSICACTCLPSETPLMAGPLLQAAVAFLEAPVIGPSIGKSITQRTIPGLFKVRTRSLCQHGQVLLYICCVLVPTVQQLTVTLGTYMSGRNCNCIVCYGAWYLAVYCPAVASGAHLGEPLRGILW